MPRSSQPLRDAKVTTGEEQHLNTGNRYCIYLVEGGPASAAATEAAAETAAAAV